VRKVIFIIEPETNDKFSRPQRKRNIENRDTRFSKKERFFTCITYACVLMSLLVIKVSTR